MENKNRLDMKNLKLLIVDDEDAFRQGLAKALSKRGISPTQAGSGEECLSILEKASFEIVILDIKMPGMNGLEVLKNIKQKYPKIEVILLTGFATTQDGVEGMKLGAFDYLSKPVPFEHLLGKILQAYQKIQHEEKIYKDAEAKYQVLLQSVTDYVVGINRNFQIIMANDLYINNFGSPSEGSCYKNWKKKDKKCDNCLVERSFEDGKSHKSEETVVMKNGKTARMLIRSNPIRNRWGDIAYVLETATDITDRENIGHSINGVTDFLGNKIADRLNFLQESEKRYRTIFERSLDAIILFDSNGKILEINQAGIEMFGFQSKESVMALNSVVELFENHEDLSRFRKHVGRDGYIKEFETKLIGGGGRTFDAVATSNVILDANGQITGYLIIIRDVTHRISAQRQIERRNMRLAALKDISVAVSSSLNLNEILNKAIDTMLESQEIIEPAGIRIYLLDENKEGLILIAHKGLSNNFISKSYMKYRKVGDGLLGQTIVDGKIKVVDNYLRSKAPYVNTIVEEGLHHTVYVPLMAKGNTFGVLCVCSRKPLKFSPYHLEFLTAVGNQIGVAVDNANVYTASKQAYEKLKEAQEQVLRAEKLASLGKLSATIAHEINNPLAAVLTYIKLMLKLMERDLFNAKRRGDIERYLETMESETARCGEIVKNLLAFSRHSNITIKPHRIEEIIDRTLALIAHDLDIKGIRKVKDIESDLPEVKCDFKQIQQALLNLMGNASESMEEGGTLRVSAKRSQDGPSIDVTVSDTGCGIPQENLKNIFEPFFTTKEEGKGVGLGLSVVFGIITRHNGSIEVESESGKGSSFRVSLPIA